MAQFIHSLMGSVIASIISQTICHPLDTCKARIQGPEGNLFWNTPQAFSKIFREEGFRGLYRGFGAILVGGTPGYVLFLTSYEGCKDYLLSNPNWSKHETAVHLLSGVIAEAICCILFVPVDVVKERLQVQRPFQGTVKNAHVYSGSYDGLRQILRDQGIRGLYKGYGATMVSYGPYSALYFALYEKMKDISSQLSGCSKDDLSGQYLLGSASFAASIAAWATNPLDLAKLRLQVQRERSKPLKSTLHYKNFNYTGTFDAISKIYRSEGIRGLYKGSCARMAFEAPNMALGISLFDVFKRLFSSMN